MMELTWSLDYCLKCDRQTAGGAYCSQACRLADHETSTTWTDSARPTSGHDTRSSNNQTRGSGFYLSPAIDFESYKTSTSTASTSNRTSATSNTPKPSSSSKPLTSSSSRSSLSSDKSDGSSSQQHQISARAQHELIAYTNSFDTTRNWRRRRTWS